MRSSLAFFAALFALAAGPAGADSWKDESGKGRGRDEHRGGHSHEVKPGKYEWKAGDCKYEYKAGPGGFKEEHKCKGGTWVVGGPPPWAPAHGYRYQTAGAYAVPFDIGLGRCNRTAIGAVLGGVGGAVVGSQVGRGDGRTVAMIGGAALGALIGGTIGHSMDQQDAACVGQVLEHGHDGRAVAWTSPQGQYRVTPSRTYEQSGRYCRDYEKRVIIGGRAETARGTACRTPDGDWQVVG